MYDIDNNFKSHKLTQDQKVRYDDLKYTCTILAKMIIDSTQSTREQSLALTKLEECSFWISAAISRESNHEV